MYKILSILMVFTLTTYLVRSQAKIEAEILSIDSTSKVITDKDLSDNFDGTYSVNETWYLLRCNSETFTSQIYIPLNNVTVILSTNSILNYCKRRKSEHSYKQLYKVISKEQSLNDSINFETIRNRFSNEDQYAPNQIKFITEYFLKKGEAVIQDQNGKTQQTFFLTKYETEFSGGVNFYLNDVDSTLFLHVNHMMR